MAYPNPSFMGVKRKNVIFGIDAKLFSVPLSAQIRLAAKDRGLNPTAIRYTLTLDPAENKLLLALQGVMQAKTGRRVPQSEVVREALRRFAASENVTVQ